MDAHTNGDSTPFVVSIIDDPNDGETKLVVMFEQLGHTAVLSLDRIIDEESISAKDHLNNAKKIEDALRDVFWPSEEK